MKHSNGQYNIFFQKKSIEKNSYKQKNPKTKDKNLKPLGIRLLLNDKVRSYFGEMKFSLVNKQSLLPNKNFKNFIRPHGLLVLVS